VGLFAAVVAAVRASYSQGLAAHQELQEVHHWVADLAALFPVVAREELSYRPSVEGLLRALRTLKLRLLFLMVVLHNYSPT
jgi:hypothetical protein